MKSALAVCWATYREVARMPIFYLLIGLFAALILLGKVFTLFSFYSETRMVKELSVSTLTLWGVVTAIFLGFLSVSQEIESRTAMVWLSKPLSRGGFLTGKFLGVSLPILAGFAILLPVVLLAFLLTDDGWSAIDSHIAIQAPATDAEAGAVVYDFIWKTLWLENGWPLVQAGLLAYFQILIIVALAVSLGMLLPPAPAAALTAAAFLLGSMIDSFDMPLLRVLPDFSIFNIQDRVGAGRGVDFSFLALCGLYAVGYAALILWAASAFLRRRDLA